MPANNAQSNDYESLKSEIDRQFATGHFVAIDSGQVIADAASHRELMQKLDEVAKSPKDMLIVQAGVEYPATSIILLDTRGRAA